MKLSNQILSPILFLFIILGIVILTGLRFRLEEGFSRGCHWYARRHRHWKSKCTSGHGNKDLCDEWDINKQRWNIEQRHYKDNERWRNYALHRKRLLEEYANKLRKFILPRGTPSKYIRWRNTMNWYSSKASTYYHRMRRSSGWRRRHYYKYWRHYQHQYRRYRWGIYSQYIRPKINEIYGNVKHPWKHNWYKTRYGWQHRANHHQRVMDKHQREKNKYNHEMLKQECDWEQYDPSNIGYNSYKCWKDIHRNPGRHKKRCDNFWKTHFEGGTITNDKY